MFKKNDLVVVIGSTLAKTKKTKMTFAISTVVEVGVHELIVSPMSGFLKRPYRISQKSCIRIPVEKMTTHVKHVVPKLGNLVMYYQTDYADKLTKKVGILMEITDYPGKTVGGIILCDGETKEFPLEQLMIIDSGETS